MSTPDQREDFEEVTAVAVTSGPDDPYAGSDDEHLDEARSGATDRVITAIAGVVLVVGMFLSWYEVVRPNGFTENTTGWQTFTHLRYLILVAALFALGTTMLQRTRLISIGRLVAGIVVAALVIRRIVSPPDLPGSTVTAQLGIYVALLGAVGVIFGGLLDIGMGDEEDFDDEDDAAEFAPDGPVAALPAAGDSVDGDEEGDDVSDVEAESRTEERSDSAV